MDIDAILLGAGDPSFAAGLADRVIAARLPLGINQRQLSFRAGCRSGTVSQAESCGFPPNARDLVGLCLSLGTTPNDLLGWDRIASLYRKSQG